MDSPTIPATPKSPAEAKGASKPTRLPVRKRSSSSKSSLQDAQTGPSTPKASTLTQTRTSLHEAGSDYGQLLLSLRDSNDSVEDTIFASPASRSVRPSDSKATLRPSTVPSEEGQHDEPPETPIKPSTAPRQTLASGLGIHNVENVLSAQGLQASGQINMPPTPPASIERRPGRRPRRQPKLSISPAASSSSHSPTSTTSDTFAPAGTAMSSPANSNLSSPASAQNSETLLDVSKEISDIAKHINLIHNAISEIPEVEFQNSAFLEQARREIQTLRQALRLNDSNTATASQSTAMDYQENGGISDGTTTKKISELKKRNNILQEAIDRLQAELETAEVARDKVEKDLEASRTQHDKKSKELLKTKEDVDAHDLTISQQVAEIERLSKERRQARKAIDESAKKIEELEKRVTTAEERAQKAFDENEQARYEQDILSKRLGGQEEALKDASDKLNATRDLEQQLENIKQEYEELRSEKLRIVEEKEALEQTISRLNEEQKDKPRGGLSLQDELEEVGEDVEQQAFTSSHVSHKELLNTVLEVLKPVRFLQMKLADPRAKAILDSEPQFSEWEAEQNATDDESTELVEPKLKAKEQLAQFSERFAQLTDSVRSLSSTSGSLKRGSNKQRTRDSAHKPSSVSRTTEASSGLGHEIALPKEPRKLSFSRTREPEAELFSGEEEVEEALDNDSQDESYQTKDSPRIRSTSGALSSNTSPGTSSQSAQGSSTSRDERAKSNNTSIVNLFESRGDTHFNIFQRVSAISEGLQSMAYNHPAMDYLPQSAKSAIRSGVSDLRSASRTWWPVLLHLLPWILFGWFFWKWLTPPSEGAFGFGGPTEDNSITRSLASLQTWLRDVSGVQIDIAT